MYVFLFLLIIPFAKPQSYENTNFEFKRFISTMPDILCEGDAYFSNQAINLTRYKECDCVNNEGSVGRAIYREPIKLWDSATGNLADFNTHFSFLIDSRNLPSSASGFAFFLAPFGSHLLSPEIYPPGSGLGLNDSFVAVEFDTNSSGAHDPEFKGSDHVGIDLNSITSAEAVEWSWSDTQNGQRAQAWISYNSSSKNLSVLVTDDSDQMASSSGGTSNFTSLSYIVDLKKYLPELVTIGFSGATGTVNNEIYNIISWNFSSNLQIDENVTNITAPSNSNVPGSSMISGRKKNKTWLWIVLTMGVGACFVVLALVWFRYRKEKNRRKRTENTNPMSADYELGMVLEVPRKFSYEELVVATNSFADEGLLGKGGFGRVYKGFFSDTDSSVAVKKIIPESRQGMKEYLSEVKTISGLRHRNLVKLIGWCQHKVKQLLIVYDFMPNKSLYFHLFKEKRLLTWEERYRIALGLASALFYMQEDCDQCVLHRDIKSSNVLLDSNFNPKLGDFGLARLVEHGQGSTQATDLMGTPGYMAPEYLQNLRATKESDIYSFGIVVLEIACGKRTIQQHEANGEKFVIELVKEVWRSYGSGNVLEAADPRLGGVYDVEQMERLIIVGLWCAHPDYNSRPSVRQVMDVLNSKAPLPDLPPTMPVFTLVPPPLLSSSPGASGFEQTQHSGNSCNTGFSKFTPSSTATGGSERGQTHLHV